MSSYVTFSLTLTFAVIIYHVSAKGCVVVDSYSFEKVASKFKVSLVKFDDATSYGHKNREFEEVCEASSNIDDLLVAEVSVKDFEEKENTDFAKKFGAEKGNFPIVKLFNQGKTKPITFDKKYNFTADNLKKFVRFYSGIYIDCTGCLKAFDEIAAKFIKENNPQGKKTLLRKAEDLWDKAKGYQEQKSAEVYVKIMRNLVEKGDEFVMSEKTRLETLLKDKISKEKKEELQHRFNILQGFKVQTHYEL